jgi:hypothetical protein
MSLRAIVGVMIGSAIGGCAGSIFMFHHGEALAHLIIKWFELG